MSSFSFRTARALVVMLVAPLAACDTTGPLCARPGRYALTLHILDAQTGLPAAYRTRVTTRAGLRMETTIHDTPTPDSLYQVRVGVGMETPGVYSVRVEKEGYQPWTRDGIVARGDECGLIESVPVEVLLEPGA